MLVSGRVDVSDVTITQNKKLDIHPIGAQVHVLFHLMCVAYAALSDFNAKQTYP